jgi:hypothetical protein
VSALTAEQNKYIQERFYHIKNNLMDRINRKYRINCDVYKMNHTVKEILELYKKGKLKPEAKYLHQKGASVSLHWLFLDPDKKKKWRSDQTKAAAVTRRVEAALQKVRDQIMLGGTDAIAALKGLESIEI